MKVLEKKDKDSIPLRIDGGRVYVVINNKVEGEFLKYAAHLLSNDLSKAVYKIETGYLFVKKAGEEITLDARTIADDSEAKFEIDSFFEGRTAEVFDEAEVPEIKKSLFSDKRLMLAILLTVMIVFFYALFKITQPKKNGVIVRRDMTSVPAPLMDIEKEKLSVIGSRLVAEKIDEIISSVRSDLYARITILTAQKTEGRSSVSYVVTAGKEYMYPELGTASGREKGIWDKTETAIIGLDKKDIKPVENTSFDACSMQMLGSGFYVRQRSEKCVDFVYDGDASKTVAAYNSIMKCYISLNTLKIGNDSSVLDVTLCRNDRI